MAPCDEDYYFCPETDCSRVFVNKLTFQFHTKEHQEQKLIDLVNRNRPVILLSDIAARIHNDYRDSEGEHSKKFHLLPSHRHQHQDLTRPFAIFSNSKAHQAQAPPRISRRQWGMHKCLQCGIIFNKEINLRLHKQKRHTNKSYSCGICGKKFLSKIRLQSHQSTHNGTQRKVMPELEYNNGSDVNNSSSSASQPPDLNPEGESSQASNETGEPEGDSFETCLTCGDAIAGPDILIHISTHLQPGQTECLHCEFQASHPKDLLDHMTVHYGLKTYACRLQDCGKAYHWKHSLARHIANSHPSANAFQCSSCDATFATLREERRHALTHVTDAEGTSTETMTPLTATTSEDGDSDKKPSTVYECNQCQAQFAKKKQLKAHESIHRRRASDAFQKPYIGGIRRVQQPVVYSKPRRKKNNESNSIVVESEKRACKTCGEEMILADLLVHIRTHVSKDQRQCELCQHVYANVESLREHMHTHYGLEPHKCTLCHKTYSLKQSVLNHIIRNHKATKPLEFYTCMIPATPKMVKEAPILAPKKFKPVSRFNGNGFQAMSPSPSSFLGSSSSTPTFGGTMAHQQLQHANNTPITTRSAAASAAAATPVSPAENGVKKNLKPINFQCNFCSRVFTTKFSVQRHEAKLHNYVESDHKRYYKTTYAIAEDSSDHMDSQSEMDHSYVAETGSSYTNGDFREHKYESLRTEIRNLLLQQDRCSYEFMFKEIPASLY